VILYLTLYYLSLSARRQWHCQDVYIFFFGGGGEGGKSSLIICDNTCSYRGPDACSPKMFECYVSGPHFLHCFPPSRWRRHCLKVRHDIITGYHHFRANGVTSCQHETRQARARFSKRKNIRILDIYTR
jgi:hypothetical protein